MVIFFILILFISINWSFPIRKQIPSPTFICLSIAVWINEFYFMLWVFFCSSLKLLQLWPLGTLRLASVPSLYAPFMFFRLLYFHVKRDGLWVATRLKVWFLTGAIFIPQPPPLGTFGSDWRHFWLSQLPNTLQCTVQLPMSKNFPKYQ